MDDLTIGIDLGTTNSCVALFINGQVKILENGDGGRITPSFIFFTSLGEAIVGEHAKRMASGKPDHGIYEVKRLVGRTFNEKYIQNNVKYLPFKIEPNLDNDPVVIVEQKNKTLKKTPQELCTIILRKLKKDVEAKLGQSVNKVVITVPAYFNVRQREVTLAAAKGAGFTVLKLFNEPTAAALSYYFENDSNGTTYSLVYDLGGGTFDVAILKKISNNIEILAVDGDTQLGGHDFDNLIVNYVCEELIRNYDYDPKTDKDNLRRLHTKCEDAKKALSAVRETVITLIGFVRNHTCVQINLTREQFEEIAACLFIKTMDIVDSCIKSSGVAKKSIKEVILSGGSTRIPKIQEMISDYFGGKALNKLVNPDECVAEGAALQAAMLSKNSKQIIQAIKLQDVIPLSLGTDIQGDEMDFLIKRNSPIPATGSRNCVTVEDRQSAITFRVFEGERTNVNKNRFLGEMTISNITPAPPGQCHVTATLNVDENGILTLRAGEVYKTNFKELNVNYARGSRSENEIRNAVRDAEQNKVEDKQFKKFAKYKRYLINYCIAVIYNLETKGLEDTYSGIYELCRETKISANETTLEGEGRLIELVEEIKLQCEPHVKYYNFELMPFLE